MRIFLRPVVSSDYDLILAWWGIPQVRNFTSTSSQPSYQQLVDSMGSIGRRDFMVMYQNRRIGRTCLIDHEDFEEISAYIAEIDLLGKGFGQEAIEATLDYAVKPTRCRIRDDNIASKAIFAKFGFRLLQSDVIPGYSWYEKIGERR